MSIEEILSEISKLLDRADEYRLMPEVVLTAMMSMATETEKYKTDIVQCLSDACRDWDV